MDLQQRKVEKATLAAYWAGNRRLTTVTLVIWALVSFGAVLVVETLDRVVIFGFPLGYYMAAQGSIAVFVALIFNYARAMDALDHKYDLHEEEMQ